MAEVCLIKQTCFWLAAENQLAGGRSL